MPRPQTKNDLLIAANEQYNKLWAIIDGMTPDEQNAAFVSPSQKRTKRHTGGATRICATCWYLYERHQLLLNWVSANQNGGEVVSFLPAPFNWKNYGEMNVGFWEKHQGTSLDDAKAMLRVATKMCLRLSRASQMTSCSKSRISNGAARQTSAVTASARPQATMTGR